MVVALNQEVPGLPQDIFQLASLIYDIMQEAGETKRL